MNVKKAVGKILYQLTGRVNPWYWPWQWGEAEPPTYGYITLTPSTGEFKKVEFIFTATSEDERAKAFEQWFLKRLEEKRLQRSEPRHAH